MYICVRVLFRYTYVPNPVVVSYKRQEQKIATHVGMRECSVHVNADKGMVHGCCSSIE